LALSPLLGGGEDPNVMGMMGKLILEFKFESLVVSHTQGWSICFDGCI
jgi:hypothetical protein